VPVVISTGLCHCKDTHLTGDGVATCELSRGMMPNHRETMHTAIRLLHRELD
jgi:hypothetical protein